MSAMRPLLRSEAVRNFVRRSYHQDSNFKFPTMDDLPVPNGSWKTHHAAQNSKYNMHLLFGVGFFAVTLVVAKSSGLVYLNFSPPSSPS